jgi:epoxyqueuosine reductase
MKKSLLLHVCCAECLGKAVGSLRNNDGDVDNGMVTLYFDNSNIHPRTEWLARLDGVKKVGGELGLELIVADWSPKKWYEAIGHEEDNSGLQRCKACWSLRLGTTAEKARERGYSYFSSTLLSSSYQDREEITRIGEAVAGEDLVFVNFEPDGTCTSSRGVYLQNYCGCIYSLKDRYEEKWVQR